MRVGPFDSQVGHIPSPVLRLESLGDLWVKRERVLLLNAAPPVAEKPEKLRGSMRFVRNLGQQARQSFVPQAPTGELNT